MTSARGALILALTGTLFLSGCVAAVVPIATGGMMGKKLIKKHKPADPPAQTDPQNDQSQVKTAALPTKQSRHHHRKDATAPQVAAASETPTVAPTTPETISPSTATLVPVPIPESKLQPSAVTEPAPVTPLPSESPSIADANPIPLAMTALPAPEESTTKTDQSDTVSLPPGQPLGGPYAVFADFALKQMEERTNHGSVQSMVLKDNAALDHPAFMSCGDYPPAVIIDIDNSTTPAALAVDLEMQARDKKPAPGLATALAQLRAVGISIIWLSGEGDAARSGLRTQLQQSKLDPDGADIVIARRGMNDRKELMRRDVAKSYCVLAIAGDKRSDADELYDYLRRADGAPALETYWNSGWFLTPPPLGLAETASKEEETHDSAK